MIFFTLLGIAAGAAEVRKLPDLTSPSAHERKRASEIETIGLAWWFKNRGMAAEESLIVAGHFSVARPIAGFAARDDRVWEIRVIHLHTGGPSGILWVNDRTGRVIGLGVEEKKNSE
jgi:hypothetical protein